jgi:hypothetical protein
MVRCKRKRDNPTDSDERVGTANPDFTGGITNTFNYKNFDLNVLETSVWVT